MEHLGLKPGHAAVKAYYRVLGQYGQLHIDHELAVRSAFQGLLSSCAHKFHWTLVPEFSIDPHHEEWGQAVDRLSEGLSGPSDRASRRWRVATHIGRHSRS